MAHIIWRFVKYSGPQMYGYFGVLNLRWSMLPDILGELNSGKLVKRCTMKNPLRFSTVFIQTVLYCTVQKLPSVEWSTPITEFFTYAFRNFVLLRRGEWSCAWAVQLTKEETQVDRPKHMSWQPMANRLVWMAAFCMVSTLNWMYHRDHGCLWIR